LRPARSAKAVGPHGPCRSRADEGPGSPTGDLDRVTADEILTLLQTLNREHGKTIVMVTHDPKAAEYARHQLHLDKGTLA
jgi:ABC-type lipoprotein export system ATPase subunit